jgi:hypothetical protein
MPWDRRYYYRARKIGGRVVREYFGRGEIAELVAAVDAADRGDRQDRADRVRAFRADLDRLDALVEQADAALAAVARAALLAAGYRQHHRGEWRKTRGHEDRSGQAGR